MESSELLEFVHTTDDLSLLKEEIDVLRNAQFQSKADLKVRPEVQAKVKTGLAAAGDHDAYFDELERFLETLNEVAIELAFKPRKSFIEKMSEWVRNNSDKKAVLNITMNEKLIGGATISSHGKFGDYSLAAKLADEGF